ncbi:hypothetical protein RRF57_002746 [Xylaria bambusicola]|uniref:Uncharacterized protein n=1 Tax=Xylaria bambusicola TaxID=326684 RepID=A0AAN7Z233_9PEZI
MPSVPVSTDIERACRRINTFGPCAGAVGITKPLEVRPPVDEIAMESIPSLVPLGKDEVAVSVLLGIEVEFVE